MKGSRVMQEKELTLNLGMLCRCCNFSSYQLPEIEGLSARQRREVEELCKLCIENFRRTAVNI